MVQLKLSVVEKGQRGLTRDPVSTDTSFRVESKSVTRDPKYQSPGVGVGAGVGDYREEIQTLLKGHRVIVWGTRSSRLKCV